MQNRFGGHGARARLCPPYDLFAFIAAATRLTGGSPDQLADLVGRSHQLCHVDAGRNAHAFQHVDHILGRDVAGRTRRIGAAAEAARRGIDHARALLHPRIEIGQRLPVSVVEMHRQIGHRHGAATARNRCRALSGVPTPMVSPSDTS